LLFRSSHCHCVNTECGELKRDRLQWSRFSRFLDKRSLLSRIIMNECRQITTNALEQSHIYKLVVIQLVSLWSPKFHYLFKAILKQLSPVHNFKPSFFKVHFIIIVKSMFSSPIHTRTHKRRHGYQNCRTYLFLLWVEKENTMEYVILEVLTRVTMKITALYPDNGGNNFFRNFDKYVPDYTSSYSRRQ
jgi:hypothetical protein